MPRLARIVVPGYPYHITQRGNDRQRIFRDDEDRAEYLSWITQYSLKHGLSLLAYCLMDNHVHFVALPRNANTLARVFSAAHMRYSQYFNKKRKASGHLWQGRFYSCLLDEPYLMAVMRYVERNPVRARRVKKPWQWEWSSAAAHIGQADGVMEIMDLKEFLDISPVYWKEFIDSPEQEENLSPIRHHTMTGWPLGRESFVTKIGRELGRRLVALPRGRPRIARIN